MDFSFCGDKLVLDFSPAEGEVPIESFTLHSGESARIFDCAVLPPGARAVGLRELFLSGEEELYFGAQKAFQVAAWRREYVFCPSCAGRLARCGGGERAMECPACAKKFFPRISPAVIALICRGDSILLAERPSPAGSFYSLVAGFVEAGESIEEALRREVREEVGLELEGFSYVSSQPWPFPSSLMIAFRAKAASFDFTPDMVEIKKAGWFDIGNLPASLPKRPSIARALIDEWIFSQRKDGK